MTALTPEQIAELRKVAEAATQGKWRRGIGNSCYKVFDRFGNVIMNGETGTNNGDHIAAFDPPTCLALLAALAEAQQRAELDDLHYREVSTRLNDLRWVIEQTLGADGADWNKPTLESSVAHTLIDALQIHLKVCEVQIDQLMHDLAEAQAERDEAIAEHGKESGFWGRSCSRLVAERDRLREQVSAMTEALTNIHNMAVEELRRFDDTELQGHMVWQIEADARAALAALQEEK